MTAKLELAVDRVDRGQGVIGAMLSPENNGKRVVANITSAADSMRTASANLEQTSTQLQDLVARMDRARGLLPQLMEDQAYAGQVMSNLRRSSDDMREVLDKINGRQGTLGLLVNDPSLYNRSTNLVSASGWGFSLFRGAYSLAHPFSTTASPSYLAGRTAELQPGGQQRAVSGRDKSAAASFIAAEMSPHGVIAWSCDFSAKRVSCFGEVFSSVIERERSASRTIHAQRFHLPGWHAGSNRPRRRSIVTI